MWLLPCPSSVLHNILMVCLIEFEGFVYHFVSKQCSHNLMLAKSELPQQDLSLGPRHDSALNQDPTELRKCLKLLTSEVHCGCVPEFSSSPTLISAEFLGLQSLKKSM